jgi:hypothetical protein
MLAIMASEPIMDSFLCHECNVGYENMATWHMHANGWCGDKWF